MKNSINFRMMALIFTAFLFFSCGNRWRGSAADTTGTNGATNGTGKVPSSGAVHNSNGK